MDREILLQMREGIDKLLAAIDKGSQSSGGDDNAAAIGAATSQPVGEACEWHPYPHQLAIRSQGTWVPLAGTFLTTNGGATQDQAESAAKAIRAVAAMEKLKLRAEFHVTDDDPRWMAFDPQSRTLFVWKKTLADAILSLAEQLEKETP